MKSFLFKSKCQNEITVYIHQLNVYLESEEFKPIGYSKEELHEIYNNHINKEKCLSIKKKHRQKKLLNKINV